jgi:RimJ/RimL family protein N-acetyltransferase
MSIQKCHYSTERLLVREWHTIKSCEWKSLDLEDVVTRILTPQVTHSLPPAWQGTYTLDRAREWIMERDSEGQTLLVIEKASKDAIGLVILFEVGSTTGGSELRLGYMFVESGWGKGFASELISGFTGWCEGNNVLSVTGGVESDNIASIRVLEKNGFVRVPSLNKTKQQLYVLQIGRNKKIRSKN